jgi:DNA replication and repair protein RecF
VGSATANAARLCALSVRDFRNLAHVDLEPPRDGFVAVGENGQGKTNLLESIHYLQILRSARGARDQDLVRFGAGAFHVAATVETDMCHELGVGFERAGKRKRVRLDGAVPERLSDALGALPSVMFSPADVDLIVGSPTLRRRFLDIMLALTSRGYLAALQRYRGALVRRNAALRTAARGARSPAAVWEPALAEHGATIWSARQAWIASVRDRFEALCRAIGENERVHLRYATSLDGREDPALALAVAFEERRSHDLARGLTQVGPHRDDLTITITGPDGVDRELRVFGSAGQQRTAAIALRMLEAATFTEHMGRAPVFLLDDPFAELDAGRSARMLELLTRDGLGQTMLAVPREDDIPAEFTGLARFRVVSGRVARVAA